jgi:hypothetical protein
LIIGGDAGVWPIAGAAAPNVKPPANAAVPFRNSLRPGRFELMDGSPSQMSLAVNRVAKAYARLGRIVKMIGMIGWAGGASVGRALMIDELLALVNGQHPPKTSEDQLITATFKRADVP